MASKAMTATAPKMLTRRRRISADGNGNAVATTLRNHSKMDTNAAEQIRKMMKVLSRGEAAIPTIPHSRKSSEEDVTVAGCSTKSLEC